MKNPSIFPVKKLKCFLSRYLNMGLLKNTSAETLNNKSAMWLGNNQTYVLSHPYQNRKQKKNFVFTLFDNRKWVLIVLIFSVIFVVLDILGQEWKEIVDIFVFRCFFYHNYSRIPTFIVITVDRVHHC